ncbi:uncharacterized protein P884DRAFT_257964 [Thermothelomyces heterothallicus CBS 202.75]|uniref:uncharacterized protein n=1 Tax=Thermothelomyces heterothallicus CBS 202.75 TaxID=1149848 RepID=UPI003743211D
MLCCPSPRRNGGTGFRCWILCPCRPAASSPVCAPRPMSRRGARHTGRGCGIPFRLGEVSAPERLG